MIELVAAAIAAGLALLAALIGGWFATRIRDLEARVDELEREEQYQWKRERQLLDFIYRQGLTPPDPPERNNS